MKLLLILTIILAFAEKTNAGFIKVILKIVLFLLLNIYIILRMLKVLLEIKRRMQWKCF